MQSVLGYFGDRRLAKVGHILYERILKQRTVSLRQLAGNRATEVRFGRFLSNKKVDVSEIKSQSISRTSELVGGRHVLCLQDTTELNYEAHAGRVHGLGPVGNGTDQGLFLHPLLAIDAQSYNCLGFGAIHTWTRATHVDANGQKKTSRDYQKLPIEDKESYRWLEVAAHAKENFNSAEKITIIADRESDIYEEWHRIPDAKTHLLTRSCHNRRLANGKLLFEYLSELEPQAIKVLPVRERDKKRTAHIAKLEICFGEVEITRSRGSVDKDGPNEVKLRVVSARELPESVVGHEKPIHWRLLTTHKVNSTEAALQIIEWYCQRWHIEQFFRTLKRQGLHIESSQLESAESLTKLVVIASCAALQTMQLTLARGTDSTQPASDVFTEEEISVLEAIQPTLEGKTEKQKNPHSKKRLAWAAWIIARLGGWKGYASERPPGPITMHRGQKEFAIIYRGWRMARNVCIP